MPDPPSRSSTIANLEDDAEHSEDDDIASEVIPAPAPAPSAANGERPADAASSSGSPGGPSKSDGVNGSLVNRRGRRRDTALRAHAGWEKTSAARRPYHEYVHSLVESGWDMMGDLDAYMDTAAAEPQLLISVLDFTAEADSIKRWPDLRDEVSLAQFVEANQQRAPGSVRLYLTEQQGPLANGIIETLGPGLDLDPRFFQWSLVGHKHVLSPSHRHHAPYITIGFAVPKADTASRTDAERFNVTVYVKPDSEGPGWTGVILFSSRTRVKISPYNLFPPPGFSAPRPPQVQPSDHSFRELFLAVFSSLDMAAAVESPFYAIHVLLRLNYVTWSDVISSIRTEDRRIHGMSDTGVGHGEEVSKSLGMIERGGSLGWKGQDIPAAVEARTALQEDFRHLAQEIDFLWQERDKMAAVRQHRSESRWTLLTNTFTYVFAPVTIISGIYGMNVQEIVGSGPDIWQFFVAVVVLNVVVLMGLAISNWIHVLQTHKRKAAWNEVVGFALGRAKHMR